MRDEMGSIEWTKLHCCCGDASHIPTALRAVCSQDPKTAEEAYWKLENHVVAQNTLYNSAEFVLSLLPDLWQTAHFKVHILNLLHQITYAGPDYPDPLYETCYQKGLEVYRSIIANEPPDSKWLPLLKRELEEPAANS